jgi:hypothetical protein
MEARQIFGRFPHPLLPPPKWAAAYPGTRTSTQQLLHQLRAEIWLAAVLSANG